eukprot:TRINITY_DN33142_c0_g1_i1.p1 TRINITY_DN33142_c0_g1~~TRINITY_DN33142_c0_g1_i1.p1  ORF type:complete len:111 (-),score=13.28 TRINITY_DN33142_c0_g1_i1:58-390(-)
MISLAPSFRHQPQYPCWTTSHSILAGSTEPLRNDLVRPEAEYARNDFVRESTNCPNGTCFLYGADGNRIGIFATEEKVDKVWTPGHYLFIKGDKPPPLGAIRDWNSKLAR